MSLFILFLNNPVKGQLLLAPYQEGKPGIKPFISILDQDSVDEWLNTRYVIVVKNNRPTGGRFLVELSKDSCNELSVKIVSYKSIADSIPFTYPQLLDSSLLLDYTAELLATDSIDQDTPRIDFIHIVPPSRSAYKIVLDSAKRILEHPIAISGSITQLIQVSDNTYLFQGSPRNYSRTMVNVNVDVLGIPFTFSTMYTTESTMSLQAINSFRFSFDPRKYDLKTTTAYIDKVKQRNRNAIEVTNRLNLLEIKEEYNKLSNKLSNPEYKRVINKRVKQLHDAGIDTADFNLERNVNMETYNFVMKDTLDLSQVNQVPTKKFPKLSRFSRQQHMIKEVNQYRQHQRRLNQLDSILKVYEELNALNLNQVKMEASETVNQSKMPDRKFRKNRFSLESLFSNISAFDLGTFDPNQTHLILSSTTITGFNLEMNPGKLYLGFTYGATLQNSGNIFNPVWKSERQITSGRVGIGSKGKWLLATTFLRGTANLDVMVGIDSLFKKITSNVVSGFDLSYRSERFNFKAELARSFNSFNGEPDTELSKNLVAIDQKYNLAMLLQLQASLLKARLLLNVSSERIDPYYYSFGSPTLRNDNFKNEAKLEYSFLGNNLSVQGGLKHETDNLYGLKLATTQVLTSQTGIKIKMKKYPFLIASYAPSLISFYNSTTRSGSAYKVSTILLSTGYTYQTSSLISTTVFTSIWVNSRSTQSEIQPVGSTSEVIMENLFFKESRWQFTLSATRVRPQRNSDSSITSVLLLQGQKTSRNGKYSANAGISYMSDSGLQTRKGAEFGISIQLPWKIRFSASYQYNLISQESSRLASFQAMNLGRITLIKYF